MIRLLLCCLLLSSLCGAQPNVLLILSDDQSWTDYSFMGHKQIETPALDKLAGQSLKVAELTKVLDAWWDGLEPQ